MKAWVIHDEGCEKVLLFYLGFFWKMVFFETCEKRSIFELVWLDQG